MQNLNKKNIWNAHVNGVHSWQMLENEKEIIFTGIWLLVKLSTNLHLQSACYFVL